MTRLVATILLISFSSLAQAEMGWLCSAKSYDPVHNPYGYESSGSSQEIATENVLLYCMGFNKPTSTLCYVNRCKQVDLASLNRRVR